MCVERLWFTAITSVVFKIETLTLALLLRTFFSLLLEAEIRYVFQTTLSLLRLISLAIILTVCHTVFLNVGSKNLASIVSLYSHHFPAWYSINIVMRSTILVTHGLQTGGKKLINSHHCFFDSKTHPENALWYISPDPARSSIICLSLRLLFYLFFREIIQKPWNNWTWQSRSKKNCAMYPMRNSNLFKRRGRSTHAWI